MLLTEDQVVAVFKVWLLEHTSLAVAETDEQHPEWTSDKLFRQVRRAYKEGAYWQSAQEWIKCSDRLPNHPKEQATVLVWNGRNVVKASHYGDADGWLICDDSDTYTNNDNITHWMPLPNGPEEL